MEGVLVAQSCPTLYDPMDCNPPASFVHWALQARILEWVAISHSNGRWGSPNSNSKCKISRNKDNKNYIQKMIKTVLKNIKNKEKH